jgi:exodeoxyribonuclease VIII
MERGRVHKLGKADYFACEGVSASFVKDLLAAKSFKHAIAAMAKPKEGRALTLGDLSHALVYEPERAMETYSIMPDFGDMRTKAAKERQAEWLAANVGKVGVPDDMWARAKAIRAAVMDNPLAAELVNAPGWTEGCLFWTDPDTGLLCKSRLDKLSADCLIISDLKTTQDASEDGFPWQIKKWLWHVQAGAYADAVLHSLGVVIDLFKIIAVESDGPVFGCTVFPVPKPMLDYGWRLWKQTLERIAECRQTGNWPGYPNEVEMNVPAWVEADAVTLSLGGVELEV